MIHVAQIIDTLRIGGAEKLQITFAAAVKERRDIKLTVIVLEDRKTPFFEELTKMGVDLHVFAGAKLIDPRRIWRLAQFARQQRFDIIHAHLGTANMLGALVGRLTGIPVVATMHNTRKDRYDHPFLETMAQRYGASRVIAVGQAVADSYQPRLGSKKIDIIPNAVQPIPEFSQEEKEVARIEMAENLDRPLLLAVGRLLPQKSYDNMLLAADILRRAYPDFILAIAGDGKLRDDLTAQIKTLGLESHVKLLGARGDIPRLLSAADIFVNSSQWEGLPVAVLEAMSAGLPVVATAVGDVPRVVVEGTGLVVPPHQPDALAAALLELLQDVQKRKAWGLAAKRRVRETYGAAAWVNQLVSLYKEEIRTPSQLAQEMS